MLHDAVARPWNRFGLEGHPRPAPPQSERRASSKPREAASRGLLSRRPAPPEETVSVPPKRTVAIVAPRSVCDPPLRMVAPLATPLRLSKGVSPKRLPPQRKTNQDESVETSARSGRIANILQNLKQVEMRSCLNPRRFRNRNCGLDLR
jgi:hypothetical protein